MTDILHQELLRQAVDAARSGDRDTALDRLKEVLEEDEENVKAWLLLARLTENEDEKRIALATVLQLEPENERAKEILSRLDAQAEKTPDDEEVFAGVTRRQFRLAIIGLIVLILVLMGVVLIISSQNAAREREEEERLARLVAQRTQDAQDAIATGTQTALNAIGTAEMATQTQIAVMSPTPTLPPTSAAPTLPPTATPPPTVEIAGPETLPFLEGLPGVISGWAGTDTFNVDFLAPAVYRLDGETSYLEPEQPFSESTARSLFYFPTGDQVIYTRYQRQNGNVMIMHTDIDGQRMFSNLDQASGLGGFNDSMMPFLSQDGTQVVFIGQAVDNQTDEVYLVQLSGDVATSTLRLTNDSAFYGYPALSPDGSQIIAVRENPESENPGPDLVLIDVGSQTFSPMTRDNDTVRETMPRFSADGSLIVFSATSGDSENHNIFLMSVTNPNSDGTLIVDDPGNAIHPVFSPDGNYLAFSSNRFGQYDLFILDLGAFQTYQLTDTREEDYPASWVILADDGS
jgi:Tol biopolymer transport system component/type II secretory pathway pseudopilin PulG